MTSALPRVSAKAPGPAGTAKDGWRGSPSSVIRFGSFSSAQNSPRDGALFGPAAGSNCFMEGWDGSWHKIWQTATCGPSPLSSARR
eukprot:CAMPEP_0175406956 /NCGR_PEP_ID=MMETSP0095-20121207/39830_1 /TAXON_ID=311494 /ORGANISM="Alexandrium monilatum, Strain CCMP3105" /LENGTH=85 /DNA_ID=CAMNT_0016705831 /DNA_START=312 /DNA_END=565 /DNA_ORIENTATION=+